jgi:hypothetical protein
LIRFAQNTGIENFNNYNTDGKVAVRFVDNVAGVQKTILCMLNQEKVGTNTDKVTYIVDKKSAGVKITLKFSSDFSDFTATLVILTSKITWSIMMEHKCMAWLKEMAYGKVYYLILIVMKYLFVLFLFTLISLNLNAQNYNIVKQIEFEFGLGIISSNKYDGASAKMG